MGEKLGWKPWRCAIAKMAPSDALLRNIHLVPMAQLVDIPRLSTLSFFSTSLHSVLCFVQWISLGTNGTTQNLFVTVDPRHLQMTNQDSNSSGVPRCFFPPSCVSVQRMCFPPTVLNPHQTKHSDEWMGLPVDLKLEKSI